MSDVLREVSGLTIFSVTGLRGNEVESALVGPSGLVGDRIGVLYDPISGERVSQKQFPTLAQLSAELERGGLRISHATYGDIWVPPADEATAKPLKVNEWGDATDCFDAGTGAAEYLSKFPNHEVGLALKTRAWLEGAGIPPKDRVNSPVHFINDASVGVLQAKAPDIESLAERFRSGLRFKGGEPFEENDWLGLFLRAGYASFKIKRRTPRCAVPGHRQDTGENLKDVPKLYDGLAREHVDGTGKRAFGVYGYPTILRRALRSVVSVGDYVEAV